jgi:hypothetical protein
MEWKVLTTVYRELLDDTGWYISIIPPVQLRMVRRDPKSSQLA